MNQKKTYRRVPRLLASVLGLGLLAGVLAVPVGAQPVDESKNGSSSLTIHRSGLTSGQSDLFDSNGVAAPGWELDDDHVVFGSQELAGADGLAKLSGISYKLERVQPMADKEGSTNITDYEVMEVIDTKATDGNGVVTFENLDFGMYKVTEGESSATKVEPFLVNVPLYDPNNPEKDTNKGWIYDVHVYPKSEQNPGMYIEKKQSSVHGNRVGWTIQVGLPADLEEGGPLVVTDEFVKGLNLVDHTVYYLYKDGTKEELVENTHYKVDKAQGTLNDKLVITIEKGTMAEKVAALMAADATTATNTDGPALFIEIDTRISNDYDHTKPLTNTASYSYTDKGNNEGGDKDSGDGDGGETEFPIGQMDLTAYSGSGKSTPLDGVTFKLYTEMGSDGKPTNPVLNDDGEDLELTTAAGGKAELMLEAAAAPGKTYYLVVTGVPTGKAIPANHVVFQVVQQSSQEVDLYIADTFILPATGGPGAVLITLGGVLLIGISIPFFVAARRRKKEEANQ